MSGSLLISLVVYKTSAAAIADVIESLDLGAIPYRCHVVVTDNFGDYSVRALCRDSGWQYVMPGRNIGFGAAHNLAILGSGESFDYVLILNPDLYISSAVIASVIKFLDDNHEAVLASPRLLNFDNSIQAICRVFPSPISLASRLIRRWFSAEDAHELSVECVAVKPERVPAMHGACFFVRYESFCQVGGFSQEYFLYVEDIDLCRKLWSVGSVFYLPGCHAVHAHGKGSRGQLKLAFLHLQAYVAYFRKWGFILDKERRRLNSVIHSDAFRAKTSKKGVL